jgi:3-hydroxyacyl-[acyl-carrier-protein] dehydratase
MAQTGGWLLMALSRFAQMPFLLKVSEAKFRGFVTPGTELTVASRRTHDGSGFAVTEARIEAAGKRVADAEISFRLLPFPAPDLEAAMRGNARRIGLPGFC